MAEPLPTAPAPERPPGLASAPPRRVAGTRSRAGNAMARTRAGLLEGALRAVARQGTRRTTMNDIAASAGVAKATLYNHFRTKDDVWAALVEGEVSQLAADCADLPLAAALELAATRISQHPALRRVARAEPAVLAALLGTDPAGGPAGGPGGGPGGGAGGGPDCADDEPFGWQLARAAVRRQLSAAGLGGDELVLRWLASHLAAPAEPDAIRAGAGWLIHGLPPGAAAR